MSAHAYHAVFPPSVLRQVRPICQLEVLNTAIAIKLWVPQLAHKLVHLYVNNAMAVAIFQTGRGKDEFIQACASDLSLMCASWDIALVVGHI